MVKGGGVPVDSYSVLPLARLNRLIRFGLVTTPARLTESMPPRRVILIVLVILILTYLLSFGVSLALLVNVLSASDNPIQIAVLSGTFFFSCIIALLFPFRYYRLVTMVPKGLKGFSDNLPGES
jgi:hypothetical protein